MTQAWKDLASVAPAMASPALILSAEEIPAVPAVQEEALRTYLDARREQASAKGSEIGRVSFMLSNFKMSIVPCPCLRPFSCGSHVGRTQAFSTIWAGLSQSLVDRQ